MGYCNLSSDPEEAAREMIRTQKMGSVGLMVLGDYNEKGLDHPDFEIIWQTANDIGMPVNVHPGDGGIEGMGGVSQCCRRSVPDVGGSWFQDNL